MTRQGVDYSDGVMTAANAKAAGLSFVCRYVSTPGRKKNMRASEVADFTAGGIDIVIVYEDTAGKAANGYDQGAADARSADASVTALGLPGCPIYFAVDFPATPGQFAAIGAYMDGAASVVGHDRTGAYGGYYVIKYLLDVGHITYAWETTGWSDGKVDPRAHILQYDYEVPLGGLGAVDRDRTICSDVDFGQYGARQAGPMGILGWISANMVAS